MIDIIFIKKWYLFNALQTSIMSITKNTGILFMAALALFSNTLNAQDVPSKPLSIPVYNPMVLNPAFVGSKDFTNIGLTTKALKYPDSQVLNLHKRLTTSDGNYSRFGFGAYGFQEQLNLSWHSGIAIAGSIHIPLDDANVHNISIGSSLKGILSVPKKGNEEVPDSSSTSLNPNMDFGVYYYGPQGFGGLSVTSVFGTKITEKLSVESNAYISRQYHLYGGYKFILSKSTGIVLEPSILVSLDDSTISEPHKNFVPYLKVYMQNFYVGTYLRSLDIFALFFQYQFPKFYTGVLLEFPRVGYLNDDNIIFELSLGINLGKGGHQFLQYRHW